MRILFLCHRVPFPPDKGEKTRAYHQLRGLAARHDVDLFTLADNPQDLGHHDALAEFCREVTITAVRPRLARLRSLPYLATRTPLTLPYFFSRALHAEVQTALATHHYERIFVYCSAMAQYVDWHARPRTIAGTPIPVLVDLVDVDSNKWTQYAASTRFPFAAIYRREGRRLRAYEREVCEAADSVLVVTEREAELARQVAPAARIHVVPIGVDTDFFQPVSPEPRPPCVVFTGDMGYFPNADAVATFARDVLPAVRRHVPGTRFLIVGRHPSRQVEQLRGLPGVEVTGYVPDVRPWLAQATLAVAPLRIAAGVQTKVLEAMASGLPVVTTTRTAQGLTRSVRDLLDIADNSAEMITKVVQLLSDPALARRRGCEARAGVIAEYSWKAALSGLVDLVEHQCVAPTTVGSAQLAAVRTLQRTV